jgi:hypothetical protein
MRVLDKQNRDTRSRWTASKSSPFYMGKNTPGRKDYIMENLVVTVEE